MHLWGIQWDVERMGLRIVLGVVSTVEDALSRRKARETSAQERARIGNVLKKLENCKEEIYPRDLERR
jgi:hypothetical protein